MVGGFSRIAARKSLSSLRVIPARARYGFSASAAGGSAPAERFRFSDGGGEIGLISSVTQPFCGSCNRLRLTSDGALRNCLFSDDELSVRDLMRNSAGDTQIALLLRRAVWEKFPGHAINAPDFLRPTRSMSMIGG